MRPWIGPHHAIVPFSCEALVQLLKQCDEAYPIKGLVVM